MKTLFFFSFFFALSLSSREAKKKKEEVDELTSENFCRRRASELFSTTQNFHREAHCLHPRAVTRWVLERPRLSRGRREHVEGLPP